MTLAFLVDRFGAGVVGDDFFALFRSARLLDVHATYQIAGTADQAKMTQGQWELVKALDALAREEGG